MHARRGMIAHMPKHPTCPVLAAGLSVAEARMGPAESLVVLPPLRLLAARAGQDRRVAVERAIAAGDFAVRVAAPAALRAAGMWELAEHYRTLPPIASADAFHYAGAELASIEVDFVEHAASSAREAADAVRAAASAENAGRMVSDALLDGAANDNDMAPLMRAVLQMLSTALERADVKAVLTAEHAAAAAAEARVWGEWAAMIRASLGGSGEWQRAAPGRLL